MQAKVKETIERNYKQEAQYLEALEKIGALLLAKYNGKKLTKRLEAQCKELFGADAIASFNNEYGNYKLSLWNVKPAFPTYDNRLSLYFGSNVDNYDASRFAAEHYIDAIKKRQAYRETLLNTDSALEVLAAHVSAIRQAKNLILERTESIKFGANDDAYSILDLAKVDGFDRS
jgi:hypothetical protein